MLHRNLLLFASLAMATACGKKASTPILVLPPGTQPAFETRIQIKSNTTLHADQAVGDFNGDLFPDLAIVGFSGEVQILLGTGTVFTPAQKLILGGLIIWIDQGDLDGDGDLDLAVLRKDVQQVNLLINDGNGNFTPGASLAIGPDSLQILVVDADADGDLDLLVARPLSPEILVFTGDGTGAFTPGQSLTLPGGGQSYTMALGDPTHDLMPDLVISDPTLERVLVFPGRSATGDFNPTPTTMSVGGGPAACSVGDLTGDGVDDIVVSAHLDNQFVVITSFALGVDDATYTSITVPAEGRASLTTIGDVTGDGLNDLVACVADRASVIVVPQLPGGGLGVPQQLDSTGVPLRPEIVDVDRDGDLDLIVLSGLAECLNLWLADSDGRLFGARNHDSGLLDAGSVVAVDLDGDGTTEVVVGDVHDTRLSVMIPTTGTTLVPVLIQDLGDRVHWIETADLDRDGRTDLVVPTSSGVKVLRNLSTSGNVQLQLLPGTGTAFGVATGPYGACVVDVDRDGRLDLVVAGYDSGELQILRGGADPFDFSGAPTLLAIGGNPVDVAALDFTGDGIVDLAVSRSGGSDVLLLANDGNGAFTPAGSLPVGVTPNVMQAGDLNGDGRLDLVVANAGAHTVTALFQSDQGFLSVAYSAGFFPSSLLVEDMTGDGFLDIVVAARLGEDFRVLQNDGFGGFANTLTFPGTLGASGLALADLDKDGDRDLIVASVITSRVSVVESLQSQD